MNFLEAFDIKKIEKSTIKKLNEEEIVSLVDCEAYKNKLKFIFKKEGDIRPYIFLAEKSEEQIEELFKALTSQKYKIEHSQETLAYNEAIKAIEEFYNPKIEAEKNLKKKEEFQNVLSEEKASVIPLKGIEERFKEAFPSLELKDLSGMQLRVRALDKLKAGQEIRIIQNFVAIKGE